MSRINFRGIKKCFDKLGQLIVDPTPVAIPVGYEIPETMEQKIARVLRSQEAIRYAESSGSDTFDQYDDFEDEDSSVPWSGYETSEIDPPHLQKPAQDTPELDAGGSGDARTPDGSKEQIKPDKADKKPKVRRTIVEEEIDD